MKKYVVGFLFNADESLVVLLRKKKPEWQAGKLNGMGGHVEPGESFDHAMMREGLEESGMAPGWEHFAVLGGEHWTMHCYRASGDVTEVWDQNDVGEAFEAHTPAAVTKQMVETIPNLRWLVPMAMETSRHDWPFQIHERAAVATTPEATP